jgi:hypothetical protein
MISLTWPRRCRRLFEICRSKVPRPGAATSTSTVRCWPRSPSRPGCQWRSSAPILSGPMLLVSRPCRSSPYPGGLDQRDGRKFPWPSEPSPPPPATRLTPPPAACASLVQHFTHLPTLVPEPSSSADQGRTPFAGHSRHTLVECDAYVIRLRGERPILRKLRIRVRKTAPVRR